MPALNLRKNLYDELVRLDDDPVEVVNSLTEQYLRDEYGVEVEA